MIDERFGFTGSILLDSNGERLLWWDAKNLLLVVLIGEKYVYYHLFHKSG